LGDLEKYRRSSGLPTFRNTPRNRPESILETVQDRMEVTIIH